MDKTGRVSSESGKEYEVDRIIGKRVKGAKVEYKVRWKSYDEDEDSWEPEENLVNCIKALAEFNQGHERTQALIQNALKTSAKLDAPQSDMIKLHNSPIKGEKGLTYMSKGDEDGAVNEGKVSSSHITRRKIQTQTTKEASEPSAAQEKGEPEERQKGPWDTPMFVLGIVIALAIYYFLWVNS